MTWLAWRQFRTAAASAVVALLVVGVYLVLLGLDLRDGRDEVLASCGSAKDCAANLAQFASSQENKLLLIAAATYLVPIVLGMFWGSPLVAAELEHRTHKLAWNQSISRRRWLLTKLGFSAGSAAVVAGVLTGLLTWAAGPVDDVAGNRFDTVVFGARHIAPVASAVFAVAAGALLGAFMKRRMPAMALTAVVVVAFQFVVPNFVRPNFMDAEVETRKMTAAAINDARSLGSITGAPTVGGLRVEDAWVSDISPLLTRNGETMSTQQFDRCFSDAPATGATGTFGDTAVCLSELDLHVDIQYHPDSRYWTFQFMEFGLYLVLAALGALLSLRLIRRTNG